jgi:fluoride exporter
MVPLGVALAAAAGAVTRYCVDVAVADRTGGLLPWGTLVVNVSGSFLLGVLVAVAARTALPPAVTVVAATGFLGAYTTFSTWVYETVRLAQEGARLAALGNAVGSLLAGVIAAGAGLALGTLLL